MKKLSVMATVLVALAMLSFGAFACESGCNDGSGASSGNMHQVTVTITGSTSANAEATGSRTATLANGDVSGNGSLNMKGVETGGSFDSSFSAKGKSEGWGSSSAGGYSLGGTEFAAATGKGIRAVAGDSAEEASSTASGNVAKPTSTRVSGGNWGDGHLNIGDQHGAFNVSSSNRAVDKWNGQSFSKGDNSISGGLQMTINPIVVPVNTGSGN